jgi:hypothetical protein
VDAATWCRRIVVVVPTKSDQRRNPRFDKLADRQRDRVGRTINGSSSTGGSPPGRSSGEQPQAMVTIAMFLLSL